MLSFHLADFLEKRMNYLAAPLSSDKLRWMNPCPPCFLSAGGLKPGIVSQKIPP